MSCLTAGPSQRGGEALKLLQLPKPFFDAQLEILAQKGPVDIALVERNHFIHAGRPNFLPFGHSRTFQISLAPSFRQQQPGCERRRERGVRTGLPARKADLRLCYYCTEKVAVLLVDESEL